MARRLDQDQYNLICRILISGAPALANELIASLSATIEDYNRLQKAEEDRNSVKPAEEA